MLAGYLRKLVCLLTVLLYVECSFRDPVCIQGKNETWAEHADRIRDRISLETGKA